LFVVFERRRADEIVASAQLIQGFGKLRGKPGGNQVSVRDMLPAADG